MTRESRRGQPRVSERIMGEAGSDFELDRQTVVWRVGFLFYGYLLLWALVLCPWAVITCRSRYRVLHKDWTCRGCKACYRGKRARKRVCDECGKTGAGRPRRRCFFLCTTLMRRLQV